MTLDIAAPSIAAPHPEALDALHRVFGFMSLKPGQAEVVSAVLAGEDVLAVMPTGAGKSLCYQVPAVVALIFLNGRTMRYQQRGRAASAIKPAEAWDACSPVQENAAAMNARVRFSLPVLNPAT